MEKVLELTLQAHLHKTIGNSGKRIIGEVREIKPRTQFVELDCEIDRISSADDSRAIREAVTSYFTEQGYRPAQLPGLPETVSLLKNGDHIKGINITAPDNPNGTPQKVYLLSILKLPL
jgi:hypothetical protein